MLLIRGTQVISRKSLTGRKEKMMRAIELGIDPKDIMDDKKHFKGKRMKTRKAKAADDD